MSRRRIRKTGLDELMIVNPSPPETEDHGEPENLSDGQYFLAEDGTFYQPAGLFIDIGPIRPRVFRANTIFLGEDGNLYVSVG